MAEQGKRDLTNLRNYFLHYMTSKRRYAEKRGRGGIPVLLKDSEKISVLTVVNLEGSEDIPTKVFNAIDESDLVVANIAGNRPAVVYELALSHALGIATILVGGPDDRSFYHSQTRIVDIRNLPSREFERAVSNWLDARNKRFDSDNPLYKYYEAPLPDISAATGLAVGYFENFVRPVLQSAKIVTSKDAPLETARNLKGLLVFKPARFDKGVIAITAELEKALRRRDVRKNVTLGGKEAIYLRVGANGWRTAFALTEDYAIDFPRALCSLSESPRLRLKKFGTDRTRKVRMQAVLAERFFDVVQSLVNRYKRLDDLGAYRCGTAEEICSFIASHATPRPKSKAVAKATGKGAGS